MTRSGSLRVIGVSVVLLTALVGRAAEGQEFINRRDQARGAFLATPQGIYDHYCAHCHGEDAAGSGRLWASELSPQPADLTALAVDREYLIEAIRDGSAVHGKSNLCPPWGNTLSSMNIERLALHIVSLGSERAQVPPDPETPPGPLRQRFPWLLTGVLLAELGLLWRMLRPRKGKSRVLSQDPAVGR